MKMNRVMCAVFLWLTSFIVGCVQPAETSFAARNDQVELDLHSLVRGQSNALLSMTLALEKSAAKGFSSPRKLGETLVDSIDQMDQIQINLPSLLADQDVEIADLRQDPANKSTLKARYKAMRDYRGALIQSLGASQTRAQQTVKALQASGRADLIPHLRDAQILSRDLNAARVMIQMQM